MKVKNRKTVLTASLVAAAILPFAIMSWLAPVIGDAFLVEQYDEIFPGDEKTPNELKIRVMNSMANATEAELSRPEGQDEVAQEVIALLNEIELAKDKETRDALKAELDAKTTRMLEVGLVLAEEYAKDPDGWDRKLDQYADSAQRTALKED